MYLKESLKESRRFYHKIAEPGFLEFKTSIYIIKTLKEIGIEGISYGKDIHKEKYMQKRPSEKERLAYGQSLDDFGFDISEIKEAFTGAVAKIDTGRPGPKIGFRFDIDALAMEESKDLSHRPNLEGFRSENDFACHACGHDGHISIGLFLADFIYKNKNTLTGSYTLIFQPAEEGLRGARSMVKTGLVDDLDYLLSGHIGMGVENGKICVGTGGFYASTKLDITFKGKSAHAGARPEEGKNANLAAASALLNLESLGQTSKGIARVNVGVIRGGSVRNSISDRATLEMEIRGENDEINDDLLKRLGQIVKGSAIQYDLDYDIKIVGSAPALHIKEENFYKEIASMLKDKSFDVFLNGKFNASEDVVYFINRVEERGGKAIHFVFGAKLSAGHHSPNFDFDESSLETAFEAYKECIFYLNKTFKK